MVWGRFWDGIWVVGPLVGVWVVGVWGFVVSEVVGVGAGTDTGIDSWFIIGVELDPA